MRGAEELFSIIERKVSHHLLLNNSYFKWNAFDIACKSNNVFIVKRVHEILETLLLDLTPIVNNAMEYAIINKDIEVIKYILSIDGVQLNDDLLLRTIMTSKFDIIVYLLNVYHCQSIPSHLHNQFHIFQFSNSLYNQKNKMVNNNSNHFPFNHKNDAKNNNNDFLELVEKNFQKILNSRFDGNRIWQCVCSNENLDVVKLIFSLKGIQKEILNDKQPEILSLNNGYNPFLMVQFQFEYKSNQIYS